MRKILVSLTMGLAIAGTALADSIYLKDGSIIKGTFVGFDDNTFTFETTRGDRESYSARYVLRVVMDSSDIDHDSRARGYPPGAGPGQKLEKALEVDAKQAWTDTGIDLASDMWIEIAAEGSIKIGESSANPEGIRTGNNTSKYPMPGEGLGSVIAKVKYRNGSYSDPFFIGSRKQMNIKSNQIGRLYLGINDDYLKDNKGAFHVNISIVPRSGPASGTPPRSRQKQEKTIDVVAAQPWTDTGIDIEGDTRVEITAEGSIKIGERSANPEGISSGNNTSKYPMPGKGLGGVIAKVRYGNGRDSEPFFVGSHLEKNMAIKGTGRLYIGINDDYLRDNRGTYRVTVRW